MNMLKSIATSKNLRCRDVSMKANPTNNCLLQIAFTLTWDFVMDNEHSQPQYFDIFCDGVLDQDSNTENIDDVPTKYGIFIGRAHVCSYRVTELEVAKTCEQPLLMTVQSVDSAGCRQIPDNNCTVQLSW